MGNMIKNKTLRPFRLFNIESRAEKIISRDKAVPAPIHPANRKELNQILKDHPNIAEEFSKKDPDLFDRLKDVYVSSDDPDVRPNIPRQNPDRPFPVSRNPPIVYEHGFKEPEVNTPGFTTIGKALKFIAEYNLNPDVASPGRIAETHNLKKETVEDILKYFRTFEIAVTDNIKSNAKFAKALEQHQTGKAEMIRELREKEQKMLEEENEVKKVEEQNEVRKVEEKS